MWRHRFSDSVGALGAACIGYTVWVIFNFDWAPATGAFWLLAGTAWSGVRAAETGSTATPAATDALQRSTLRSVGAVALAVAAVGLGVLPLVADARYSQARPDLAVALDPLQARYRWDYGLSLAASGDPQAGVAELRRAADFGETEPQLYVDLGDAERKLGDVAAARRAYQQALVIDPFFAPARQRLGELGA